MNKYSIPSLLVMICALLSLNACGNVNANNVETPTEKEAL